MDETPATTAERPRRRWFRPGLRAMMLLIVAVGVVFGWAGHRARVQRDAVAAITRPRPGMQVSVYYDWQFTKVPPAGPGTPALKSTTRGVFDPKARPPGPKWLREALGPDVFETLFGVVVQGDGIDDEFLSHVAKLRTVEELTIRGKAGPGLTPAGMAQIRSLDRLKGLSVLQVDGSRGFIAGLAGKSGLRRLRLSGTAATDDDMAVIGGLPALEGLYLDGRNITDRGFGHVARLKALTSLELPEARITDLAPVAGLTRLETLALDPTRSRTAPAPGGPASLAPLRGLTNATQITLWSTKAGDRDLAVVAALPKLRHLAIGGRGITGDGLARLAASPSLTQLRLYDTSVADLRPLGPRLAVISYLSVEGSPLTDAGVEPLARMARLRTLALTGTKITDDGLAHIAGLPAVRELVIDRAAITDAGLARLAPLRSLTSLGLYEVGLTDASVVTFASFPALKSIRLDRSGMTPAGVDRLRKALPGVWIPDPLPPG